jgi:stress response protein YsnF
MKTLIAAFSDNAAVQQAEDYLRDTLAEDESNADDSVEVLSSSAIRGDSIETLTERGIPRDRAPVYAEVMRRGGTILIAHVPDDDADDMADRLDGMGSLDLDAAENYWRGTGWTGYDASAEPYDLETSRNEFAAMRNVDVDFDRDANLDRDRDAVTARGGLDRDVEIDRDRDLTASGDIDRDLEVVEEKVNVGKRQVSRGGVRVRTFIVERPVHETVQLHEEHIDVSREPVNEPLSASATDSTLTEDEFTVTATGEEAVVGKEARVVERVHVGKTAETREETIDETERRRDVEVERLEEDEKPLSRP